MTPRSATPHAMRFVVPALVATLTGVLGESSAWANPTWDSQPRLEPPSAAAVNPRFLVVPAPYVRCRTPGLGDDGAALDAGQIDCTNTVLLSLGTGFGVGHYYAGNDRGGTVFLFVDAISLAAGVTAYAATDWFHESNGREAAGAGLLLMAWIVPRLFEVQDALRYCRTANELPGPIARGRGPPAPPGLTIARF